MNYSELGRKNLKEALRLQQERYLATLPSEEKLQKVVFSEKFERKMNKLIRDQRRSYYFLINSVGKKIACLVLIILLMMTTTVFSVKALREPFVKFIVETYDKFTSVIFNKEEIPEDSTPILAEIIVPEYIPEGYSMVYKEELILSYYCEYKNEEDSIITYDQYILGNTHLGIDTENTIIEKIFVNELEAIYYENKGYNTIIFSSDSYGFTISGTVEKKELLKIAESLK